MLGTGILVGALVAGAAVIAHEIHANHLDDAAAEDLRLHPDKYPQKLVAHVADAQGFDYMQYCLVDSRGNEHVGYRRAVPTTYPFSCPDCGAMVVGADTPRVRPGGRGPEPTAYVCEGCGRRETSDFGVPRIEYREAEMTFEEPRGMQTACPRGGRHDWQPVDSASEATGFPEGVEPCTENLSFAQTVRSQRVRCSKCGEERVQETVVD